MIFKNKIFKTFFFQGKIDFEVSKSKEPIFPINSFEVNHKIIQRRVCHHTLSAYPIPHTGSASLSLSLSFSLSLFHSQFAPLCLSLYFSISLCFCVTFHYYLSLSLSLSLSAIVCPRFSPSLCLCYCIP